MGPSVTLEDLIELSFYFGKKFLNVNSLLRFGENASEELRGKFDVDTYVFGAEQKFDFIDLFLKKTNRQLSFIKIFK